MTLQLLTVIMSLLALLNCCTGDFVFSIMDEPKDNEDKVETNWTLCALCQVRDEEKLICPQNSTRPGFGSGYSKLAQNLIQFQSLAEIPMDLTIDRLNDGSSIEDTLAKNNAVWHKTCFNRFSDLRLQRKQKRKADLKDFGQNGQVKTRRGLNKIQDSDSPVCFFCDKSDGTTHRASTLMIDENVRQCAIELQDTSLLTKLAMSDMHAIDAYYHRECLISLYNRCRKPPQESEKNRQSTLQGLALSSVISHIEESRRKEHPIFKLSELVKLYVSQLNLLQATVANRENSTHLKERILNQIPDLRASREGRDVIFTFVDTVGPAVLHAHQENYDSEATCLARAASIIRKSIFKQKQHFDGTFAPKCHKDAVPDELHAFVTMLLEGRSVPRSSSQELVTSNATLSISELLIFNAVKTSHSSTSAVRHNTDKETPLAIYIALLLHNQTRSKGLIDKMHRLGLCISYDRVMQISADIGNSLCDWYQHEGCVCPPKLREQLLTIGCVDNIDHHPSSRTSKDSFHGTAITLTQQPTRNQECIHSQYIGIDPQCQNKPGVMELPLSFSTIEPVAVKSRDVYAPVIESPAKAKSDLLSVAKESEKQWLETVEELLSKAVLEREDYMHWSAYHAAQLSSDAVHPVSITALLLMFHENAHTAAMIQHSMKVIKESICHLNPGQTPIICMDQPLFALAKQIQWFKPDLFGEDKYVVMMGGLHVEMASLRILGNWLSNSGWTTALVEADITTSGRADAMLKAPHVTRTRYAHQVTVCALHVLKKSAYASYVNSRDGLSHQVEFQDWSNEMCAKSPQFHYWNTAMDMEILVLEYIHSIREGSFPLYVQTLGQLTPGMFSLDHNNYARWMPVHIRDMTTLEKRHPVVYEEFLHGKFVVRKTTHMFSCISLDQNHEQENKMIKGDGGAVGLTENAAALRRWMIAGPVIARVVKEFEETFLIHKRTDVQHHDQVPSVQLNFARDVKSLVEAFDEMGNPFISYTTAP